jgi:hypothetical protein
LHDLKPPSVTSSEPAFQTKCEYDHLFEMKP